MTTADVRTERSNPGCPGFLFNSFEFRVRIVGQKTPPRAACRGSGCYGLNGLPIVDRAFAKRKTSVPPRNQKNLIGLRCCVSSYSEKPFGELDSPVAASQESLLKAVAQADQIRAIYPKQLEAWLKETLVNSVRDCIKFHSRQQRTISRE
jgi:hypothetical protein